MSNPNRARGGFVPNGRGGPQHNRARPPSQVSGPEADGESHSARTDGIDVSPRGGARGVGARGAFVLRARGRGFAPNSDRGRGALTRGFRGRGRITVPMQT